MTSEAAALDQLVVASATYRDLDTGAREALAQTLDARTRRLPERVLLQTCHRVELVAFGEPDGPVSNVPDGLRWLRGTQAAEHLMLVAGGLDSAVLAEEQVLGQVREAYQSSLDRGETGPVINELMRRAIRFGKRVRSFAQAGDRSLADRAARWVAERLVPGDEGSCRALVVGTGEMGRRLAVYLAGAGTIVTVASRSVERAESVVATLPRAERHHASLTATALASELDHDVVGIAVHRGMARIDARHLAGQRMPLVVDLSSPAAVTPEAAKLLGDRLLDLDRLGAGPVAGRLSPAAERRLREEARGEASRFAAWLQVRASGDGIAILRAHAEEVRRRHVERLRRRSNLDDEQAAAVEAMTAALVGELMHLPTVGLRQDPEAVARVRQLFGIDR